jgi:hypothetical protein
LLLLLLRGDGIQRVCSARALCLAAAQQRIHLYKNILLLNFPHVCLEPVLANIRCFSINWREKKTFPHLCSLVQRVLTLCLLLLLLLILMRAELVRA